MNFNTRQLSILNQLFQLDKNITVEVLSDKFNVSPRTIYNDMQVIKGYLNKNDIKLLTDASKNYYISGDSVKIKKLLPTGYKNLSVENRQMDIFIKIFLNGETVSYSELSKKWYVSKSSISNDIHLFKEEIEMYQLKIVSNNKGSYVVGQEDNIQKYCVDKINFYRLEYNITSMIDIFCEFLTAFFSSKLINSIFEELLHLNNRLTKKIQSPYLELLFISLLVLVHRKLKKIVLKEETTLYQRSEIDKILLYGFANDFSIRISEKLDIYFSSVEINYITNLFLGFGIEPFVSGINISNPSQNIVVESIDMMSEMMKVNFSEDSVLKDNLLFHIEPMMYRLKMNMRIKNSLLKELKSQYSIIFNATWYVFSNLMNQLNLKISEEEISYLMIHFQSSIERKLPSSRVLFIGPSGIGLSQLAVNRLNNILPRHVIIEYTNDLENLPNNIEKYDLIFSTIQVNIPSKNVIKVSPLIDSYDQENILSRYKDSLIKDYDCNEKKNLSYIKEVVSPDYIFLQQTITDKEDLIRRVINHFKSKELVKKGCLESILEREKMGDTALRNGIAIPHSDLETVNRTCIGIITCKKPIQWGTSSVRLVFVICIAKEDISKVKNILSEIETIIDNTELIDKLLTINDSYKMYDFLFNKR